MDQEVTGGGNASIVHPSLTWWPSFTFTSSSSTLTVGKSEGKCYQMDGNYIFQLTCDPQDDSPADNRRHIVVGNTQIRSAVSPVDSGDGDELASDTVSVET